MLAIALLLIFNACLLLYVVTITQDVRDLMNIMVNPFLYEKDATFNSYLIDDKTKAKRKKQVRETLKNGSKAKRANKSIPNNNRGRKSSGTRA